MRAPFYAAIGSNGWGEVVWGIGPTPADAQRAAFEEGRESSADPEIRRTVEITPETRARIEAGEVDTASLGI